MECCKELRSGFSYVLADEESLAVDAVLEENVVQLQDDADLIVRFAVLIFVFEVDIYALADFFQFSIMPDDLIVVRATVAQKFCFHRIDYITLL